MNPFAYAAPVELDEAVRLLATPGAAALAGGTDLLGLMKDGVVSPRLVVDLRHVPGLAAIERTGDGAIRVGALVTVGQIEQDPRIQRELPILAQAAAAAASPQLRNVGTLGGNLSQRPRCWYFRGDFHCQRKGGEVCFAEEGENENLAIFGHGPCHIVHPSDLAPALIALGASAAVVGPRGARQIPLADFFVGVDRSLVQETVLQQGEVMTQVEIPPQPSRPRGIYLKAMGREAWTFALASVAAQLTMSDTKVRTASIVLGGVAPTPWRAVAAERVLAGAPLDPSAIAAAADAAIVGAEPMTNNGYKIELVRRLTARALEQLTDASG